MNQDEKRTQASSGIKRIRVCGVGIDSLTMGELLPLLDRMVETGKGSYVSFVDGNLCARAIVDPAIVRVLDGATLVLPDGAGLVLGARLIGEPLAERLVGPNVVLRYLVHGVAQGRKHFFYGGAPGIAELMKERLVQQIPGLQVVGTYCPPFRELLPEEEAEVKEMIEQSGAEVVWVGLGAPKQDLWMSEHALGIDVPLMLGVGAAFDYLSGTKKRAPALVQKMGMEWLHRMCTQGGRIFWRNANNLPIFAWALVKQVLTARLGLGR